MKRGNQILGVVALLIGGASSAHAGFIGTQLSSEYFYPDSETSYAPAVEAPPQFFVGDGVETVVNVEGVTSIAVDVSDTSILFDFSTTLLNPRWGNVPFNGLIFNVVNDVPLNFSSFNISSNFEDFDPSRVSFSNSQVTVNWAGLAYDSNTMLLINFETDAADVPEPATMTLLGLGFVSAIAMRRRGTKVIKPRQGLNH